MGSTCKIPGDLNVTGDLDVSGDLGSSLVNLIYPVGAVYISVASTNPESIWAGTSWSAFGAGRTLVSLSSGDSDFNVAEETGGSKTHTLTTAQLPSHAHNQPNHTHTQPNHTHSGPNHRHHVPWSYGGGSSIQIIAGYGNYQGDNLTGYNGTGATGASGTAATGSSGTAATGSSGTAATSATGSGSAHPIVQPYIVTYMWKRTA
jgi:microcystin-dependent protein